MHKSPKGVLRKLRPTTMPRSKRETSKAGERSTEGRRSSSRSKPRPTASNLPSNDSGSETESCETGDEWEVEKVLDKMTDPDSRVLYLLKWKNWKGEPTWEPLANLRCDRLVDEFEDWRRESRGRRSSKQEDEPTTPKASKPKAPSSINKPCPLRFKKTPKRGSRI